MIILEILKIIAIIIGCIAGFAILVVLLLALCPLRYKILLTKNSNILKINGSVRWILGFVTVKCTYIENAFNYYIRLAGFKIIDSNKESEAEELKNKKAKDNKKAASVKTNISKDDNSPKDNNFEKKREKKDFSGNKHKKKTNKNIIKKIKAAVRIINDDSFKPALKHVRIEILNLLSHIRPKKIYGKILLGLASPDKTALVYAAAANMINIIGADVMLEPDMDEQVFECNITVHGRMYLGYIVVIAIRSLLNKEFMTFVKKLRSK